MQTFTGDSLKALRKDRGHTQLEIAKVLGLTKQAISKIENGLRSISPAENKVLNLFFYGRDPDGFNRSVDSLNFTDTEWIIIEKLARRAGFENPRQWIVSQIRVCIGVTAFGPDDKDFQHWHDDLEAKGAALDWKLEYPKTGTYLRSQLENMIDENREEGVDANVNDVVELLRKDGYVFIEDDPSAKQNEARLAGTKRPTPRRSSRGPA